MLTCARSPCQRFRRKIDASVRQPGSPLAWDAAAHYKAKAPGTKRDVGRPMSATRSAKGVEIDFSVSAMPKRGNEGDQSQLPASLASSRSNSSLVGVVGRAAESLRLQTEPGAGSLHFSPGCTVPARSVALPIRLDHATPKRPRQGGPTLSRPRNRTSHSHSWVLHRARLETFSSLLASFRPDDLEITRCPDIDVESST